MVKESNINFHNWYTTAECFHHPTFKKIIGCNVPNWIMKIENDNGEFGVIEKEWLKAGEMFAKRMEAGRIDIFDIEQKHYQAGKKIWQLTDFVYKNNLADIPTLRLLSALKKMWVQYGYLNSIGYIAVISDLGHGYLMGRLSKILLQKKVSARKIQTYQSLLSSPNKESLFWQELLELLKLCNKYKNIKKLETSAAFNSHIKKWFWLNYGYQGPVWTKDDFSKRAREIYRLKNVAAQLKRHEHNFSGLTDEQKALNKKLKMTACENYYFETARLFTYLKGYRIEIRHRYSYALDQIFLELGRRLNLPLNFFRYALKKEIIGAITKKTFHNEEILKRRQRMLYILENQKGYFIRFDLIDKTFKSLLAEEKINFSGSVTGQTAFPGKVRGRVKILNNSQDNEKIKPGDILVTFATTPDFLPAMMKAAAYVTDQGGVTSHAAITAREMKKPCVIGTQFASKVFIDGDMVEVDANKGIVKKLK